MTLCVTTEDLKDQSTPTWILKTVRSRMQIVKKSSLICLINILFAVSILSFLRFVYNCCLSC